MTASVLHIPVEDGPRPVTAPATAGGPGPRELDFEGFAATRWRRLVRTAYLLTGDYHEAEDVVQATFAKVFRNWSRISRLEEPDAYIHRALVNNNLSRHRRRRVRQLLVPVLPDRASTAGGGHGGVEERSVLLQALAELPPRQRAVVVLRYWEDMSEGQVAEVLDCSPGNVKSQASRGLAKLRGHPALVSYAVGTGSTIDGTDGGNK
ncbi:MULTISPECIES: SigE family RNA polymerase sigma factor [unclassified Streptomyces]|uniref:SigE family RNA polymerase sigma factor n=1 Tax=Streptomycetaceae TaxID=2062 RepID=UPI002E75E660|nr:MULTISPECIES: SigE family RNA polymerase sigma factor [unclassified Streptomyces]MED7949715.1 SigE family RNA polymerase sigma factor [Streptomyces sp. BE303]MEE1823964.1 SigE family RNA polymerase sigma factor [Streptomyces sp. BE20]